MNEIFLHIDMDAFYASVEQQDHPELRGKPVIVGGRSMRAVVSAASYEARRFGVRSAMPLFQAKKRCPDAIVMPVRMARYQSISRQIMGILQQFSPLVEQVSIDEAFMSISGMEKLFGSPETIGRSIKEHILKATNLTCSIGIASAKFLAKIASDMDKPDGLFIISPDQVERVIDGLPIEKVPGVGKRALEFFHGMGVHHLGDVRRLSESFLSRRVGVFGSRILDYAKGIDPSMIVSHRQVKSVSSETTLEEDTKHFEILRKRLMEQAEMVGRRLRGKGLIGKTVHLKLKRANFKQVTRTLTLETPTGSTNTIYEGALSLLEAADLSEKVRLIGVGISKLMPAKNRFDQLYLFPIGERRNRDWEGIEKAMDHIKDKFGHGAIKRGR